MKTICLFFLLFPTFLLSQSYYFPPVNSDEWTLSNLVCDDQAEIDLVDFLDENNTKAFIILKEGKILMEEYFDSFTQDSVWYWASAGKTITATMIGMAQESGQLDVNDKTADYLDDWTNCTIAEEDKITIRHQLTMTTGFNDGLSFECTEPECLECLHEPNTRWFYHNAPYTLLLNVLEAATGQNENSYYNQNIGQKIGAPGLFISSMASDNNVFWSKPRAMARFGLLHLANGNWDGQEIFPSTGYFTDMKNTSQNLNKSYGYLWWLNGKESFHLPGLDFEFNGEIIPNAPDDMYAGLGKNDQKLYIVPSQDLVVIRLGNAAEGINFAVSDFDDELWEKINNLSCTISNINELKKNDVAVFPNPSNDFVNILADEIERWELIDLTGRILELGREKIVELSHYSNGIYFCRVYFKDGRSVVKKVVVSR